jgi:cell surface protein SprA
LNPTASHILRTLVLGTLVTAFVLQAGAQTRYPLNDRRGDPYSYPNRNTFDLRDTGYIKRNIEYDPKTKQYYIVEKIGNSYYRTPVSFSMEEFLKLQGEKDEAEYFRKRAALLANMNRRLYKPKFKVSNDWFNRIMGVGPDGKVKVEIHPTGFVEMLAGYQGQVIKTQHYLKEQERMEVLIST